ncbi:MAG: hypothetical protein CMC74_07940 [Flavobacteriaceae bacterium]|nr:hypothetical protein [Flavobacteriaceae bacterium]|tara:strand:- start:79 stop:840 length:762 start_codon:yes stop_codon:yes gene_type:complete
MRFLSFLFIFSIITVGCETKPSIAIKPQSFSEKELAICKNEPCSEITLDYLLVEGEPEIAKKINTKIKDFLIAALFLGEDENPSAKTINEAAKQFILAYRDHKNEFEFDMAYEANVSVRESFKNDRFLSLEMRSYLFTGGAHGYGSVLFRNFDLETGALVDTQSLFNDWEAFQKLAEKAFREQHEVPSKGSINATGFWFEKDRFYVPELLGFTENGLIFIYNQYDIASYAAGQITVEIPWKEIQPLLNKTYFP